MLSTGSSSNGFFQFVSYLLLLICCVVVVTSYRIEHRPFENRNERAVTEWRFRRNFLFPIPYFYPNDANEHFGSNEDVENENDTKNYRVRYAPHLIYDQTN
ncbi:unnamed protein product [Adineta ricciae]|nr:unnamed protein product [Adineta ricciae]